MGQGQSLPPRPVTPEPEISEEERAQAQADVSWLESPISILCWPLLTCRVDARKATSCARQALCGAAKEADRNDKQQRTIHEEVDGAGTDEQGELGMEECGCAG
jgi:hypothetical protein